MNLLDRRRFLQTTAAAALTSAPLRSLAQAGAQPAGSVAARLILHPDRPGPTIPQNFVGLSYEVEQLSDPGFFSVENPGLIKQMRALSPQGVLRLGGNTSDVGWWKPTPASTQPPLPPTVVPSVEPNTKPFQTLAYSITPQAISNLRSFLDATGWTCLFGINLATNTPARGAEQAAFVTATLGPKLEYFQLGNEPDLFDRRFRDKATWNVDRYLDEWLLMANAIRARVPDARFGLPDTAGDPTWSSRIADRLGALPKGSGPGSRPNIAAVSHHYYFGGPPSNPQINIPRLMRPDPKVASVALTTKAAANQLGVPYRMTEGNTCYQGGKPGVSDVFAAALWAADYALFLASHGYAGVNIHGGGGKAVGNSLGGHLPGEALLPANELGVTSHPRPFYTPIADMGGQYVAQPDFYGLLFAQQFAGATVIPLDFNPGPGLANPPNATAYAALSPIGQTMIAIINKDEHLPLNLDLPGFSVGQQLTAPSITSRSAQLDEPQSYREASIVPPASAVLLLSARI
ncbi:MAG: hypothetical protein ACRYFU_12995 [Janthinobacterium lividum]